MAPFSSLRATLTQAYPPAPAFTEANAPPGSQNGRVFIVTGGNAGIGLELCKILYASGATIYMASRSQTKAEAVIKTITEASKSKNTSGKLKFLHLDLNDLLVVKAAAESFAQQEDKLDVLWNNAGTGANMVTIGQRTAQDFEPMIGMHCIATLLFTKLLLPQLRAAATSGENGKTRVIWTSSALAEGGSPPNGLDFDMLDKGTNNRTDNYGTSKAGTWILSREFARRYAKDGIVSVCLNPGFLKTASFNGTPAAIMFVLNKVLLSDAIYGAYTELYAGLSSDITLENTGSYIIPWGRIRPNEATPRQDLIKAGDSKEEGGLDYGNKFWVWCEEKWNSYI
ncbi:Glucose/ribitol dehydrogenase [Penicillium robsamsonii]|uniref:Glucose/ribitol dehydrogenase n=1 Tax=Penicillium robsamsonii TaxID=1792511 RepID=UPI002547B49F|nr:Glucose/ribitol dehydrogenase [Penicillium robsamsonii]KAJ5823188.1 Glucose/ribitol dehydrogenase [Penicillium robsamsonii]